MAGALAAAAYQIRPPAGRLAAAALVVLVAVGVVRAHQIAEPCGTKWNSSAFWRIILSARAARSRRPATPGGCRPVPPEAARRLDGEVIAGWKAEEARLAAIVRVSPASRALRDPLARLIGLRRESLELLRDALTSGDPALLLWSQRKQAEANQVAQELIALLDDIRLRRRGRGPWLTGSSTLPGWGFTYVQAKLRTNGGAIPIAQREEDAKFTSRFITADPAIQSLADLKGRHRSPCPASIRPPLRSVRRPSGAGRAVDPGQPERPGRIGRDGPGAGADRFCQGWRSGLQQYRRLIGLTLLGPGHRPFLAATSPTARAGLARPFVLPYCSIRMISTADWEPGNRPPTGSWRHLPPSGLRAGRRGGRRRIRWAGRRDPG